MYVRVMVMSGPDDGLEIDLYGQDEASDNSEILYQFSIGRREGSDICIPFDTSVSRLHAYLQVRKDGLWLADQDSRNGTFLRRRRLKAPEPLLVGELFQIGHTWLRVQAVEQDKG
jgi:pSer/pThr/pTyr-binding forkhead associated (FHA) protein